MAKLMGLMGAGISRSRMPRLQQYLGSLTGVDIEYRLIDGDTEANFDPVLKAIELQANGFTGLNVTHPYKQRVCQMVSGALVDDHQRIGSYNTLVFKEQSVIGANTDYSGFIRGFRYRQGDTPPGRVLMAGAGGVGRAIAFALGALGATHISLYDINSSQSASLCASLQEAGFSASVVSPDDLEISVLEADGLVNCTAIGMYSHPGSIFASHWLGGQRWVFDAVYTPLKTEFIQAASMAGLDCISGFDLWIYQGLHAFKIFTGVNVEATEELITTAQSWLD